MESIKQNLTQVAEIELAYRSKVKPSDRPKVQTSKTAYELFLSNWDKDKLELIEQFKVLLTNRSNKALGIVEISSGGLTGTVADPKLIFAAALKAGACGFILCHNHPCGNLTASQSDIALTKS